MKIFVFMMAVLVLICSCMPCMDRVFAMNDHKDPPKISKSTSQQEHSDRDSCSPFCSCNCCSGISYLFTTYQVSDPIWLSAPKKSFQLPSEISDAALPVWQPPQLA